MNETLAAVWDERLRRLRLGVEPIDPLARPGPLPGLGLHLEDVPRPHPVPRNPFGPGDDLGLPGVRCNPSGRFALVFGGPADQRDRLVLRIVDPGRRLVPRRLSVPVPDLATVRAADLAHDTDPAQPLTPRVARPVLFPGAAHGAPGGATVLRGRATWGAGGPPAAWARIEARVTTGGQPQPWRTHADDRGEFLLVIGILPRLLAVQNAPAVDVEVTVRARPLPADDAPVDSPAESRADPLWHLPIERVAALDAADPVLTGAALPAGYTATTTRVVRCARGRDTRPAPFALS
jgi:hypothetical protein